MLLVVDECVRREVEEVEVGGEVREFFEWAFVWGDVDPHGGGLSAGEPDGTIMKEHEIVFARRASETRSQQFPPTPTKGKVL